MSSVANLEAINGANWNINMSLPNGEYLATQNTKSILTIISDGLLFLS